MGSGPLSEVKVARSVWVPACVPSVGDTVMVCTLLLVDVYVIQLGRALPEASVIPVVVAKWPVVGHEPPF